MLKGTQACDVCLDRLHRDVTRIACEGSYDASPCQDPRGPQVTYGFAGKEDPTRKQLTVSLSMAVDGAIPAWHQVADGRASEGRAYPAHLAAVREHLRLEHPLMIGDSKLVTRSTMLAYCRVNTRFVGLTSLTEAERMVLRARWADGIPLKRLGPMKAPSAQALHAQWFLGQALTV